VGVCEQRPPIGNLRQQSFMEIWHSQSTGQVRKSISDKECYCTNEIFMWPSIVFQPKQLAKSMVGAKVWQRARPLPDNERADYAEAAAVLQGEDDAVDDDPDGQPEANGFAPVVLPVVQKNGTEGTP
jgi:hypothetical protein